MTYHTHRRVTTRGQHLLQEGGLTIDNGLPCMSLTTFNFSRLKVGMSSNLSTASMEDTSRDKSRSSTATSAAVRRWASNGHTVQWNRQKRKSQKCINTETGKPIYTNALVWGSITALGRNIPLHWSGQLQLATTRVEHVEHCQTCTTCSSNQPSSDWSFYTYCEAIYRAYTTLTR